MDRTSSESRCSENEVKLTRSANSTETKRRSVLRSTTDGAASVAAPLAEGLSPESKAVPHSLQNLFPGSFEVPQFGHAVARAEPQFPQNLCPAGFAALQFPQIVIILRDCRTARAYSV